MSFIEQDDLIRHIETAMHKLCASTSIACIGGCSVFLTLGMGVRWHGVTGNLAQMVEVAIRRETGDVPIEMHYDIVPGSSIELRIVLSDGEARGRALLKMLNPSDSIVDWVVQTAPSWDHSPSANHVLGLGIGGNPEMAMQMARVALFEPHDIACVIARGPNDWREHLRAELMSACARAGCPVKDVLIVAAPTHAGTKPVALMCGEPFANRVAHIVLNGNSRCADSMDSHLTMPLPCESQSRTLAPLFQSSFEPESERPFPQLNEEQQKSQISSGHRLIGLVRKKRFQLYSHGEFVSKAIHVSADYWLDHFMPALRTRMNEVMAQRTNAAIARARKQSNHYGVKKIGPAELVAEALYDNWWFKAKEHNLSRTAIRDHIQENLNEGRRLRLHLPILSRKPFSPIKNRGPYPDLAEIHTLARCAEAGQVINALSPTGCEFVILADGFKYNRACRTPDKFVAAYQEGLRFWIDHLDVGDIVTLVNYEDWVRGGIDASELKHRASTYERYCESLASNYGYLFDAADLDRSLAAVEDVNDIGSQLGFTFRSIVTSNYYADLFALSPSSSVAERHYGDEVQQAYIAYVSSLHRRLDRGSAEVGFRPTTGHLAGGGYLELFHSMRKQAWDAAIRYVAISLADREMNMLKRIDQHAIKLTIHSKKGELRFLSASQQDATMTAQHCVGGLAMSKGSAKVSFQYRLERESNGERPVLVERLPDTEFNRKRYGPLHSLQTLDQPLFYAAESGLISSGQIHSLLTRKG